MLSELKNRIVILVGALCLAIIGRDRFYQFAQDRTGILGRIASGWCQGHAGRIGMNYAIWRNEKDKDRITDIALAYYSDDSLHGFGEEDYSVRANDKTLLEQQRGLVVEPVAKIIRETNPKRVIELGTGNGDILEHMASAFPDVEFVGVDLSVTNAIKKHGSVRQNMTFIKGYALDLFQSGDISGDVVFGTSTFCVFAPNEFAAYLDSMKDTTHLVISDPVTFGNKHTRDPQPKSRHMDLYMWWHNYFGWLTSKAWTIDSLETVSHNYSHNRDAQVVLVAASRTV